MAEWRVRRGDSEWPVESFAALQDSAMAGRLNESDYIFNPVLAKWMYAHEVLELRGSIAHAPNTGSTRPDEQKHAPSSQDRVVGRSWEGLIILIVAVAMIIVSTRIDTWRDGGTLHDYVFYGGVLMLVAGGVATAYDLSKSKATKG
jgi:hypothetical protein